MNVALSVWKLFVCASLEGVQTASCAAPLTAGGRDDENQFLLCNNNCCFVGIMRCMLESASRRRERIKRERKKRVGGWRGACMDVWRGKQETAPNPFLRASRANIERSQLSGKLERKQISQQCCWCLPVPRFKLIHLTSHRVERNFYDGEKCDSTES